MRTWILLTFLAALVYGQEGPGAGEEKPPAPPGEPAEKAEPAEKKEWQIEAPASNPAGEAMKLGPTFRVGVAQAIDAEMTMKMDAPMPMTTVMGFAMKFKILSEERGEYGFECPFKFTKMTMNGQDMLQMVGAQLAGLKMVGRIDKDGKPIQGTVKFENMPAMMGAMGPQLEGQLTNMLGYWPKQTVRIGQTWELPVEEIGGQVGMVMKGAKIEGKAYQTFEAVEQHAGADCARTRMRVGARIFGDNVQMQAGMKGKVDMTMKGDVLAWMGLDGYQRGAKGNFKMRIKMDVGMGPMDMNMTVAVNMTGGPEPVTQEQEQEEPARTGAGDD